MDCERRSDRSHEEILLEEWGLLLAQIEGEIRKKRKEGEGKVVPIQPEYVLQHSFNRLLEIRKRIGEIIIFGKDNAPFSVLQSEAIRNQTDPVLRTELHEAEVYESRRLLLADIRECFNLFQKEIEGIREEVFKIIQ